MRRVELGKTLVGGLACLGIGPLLAGPLLAQEDKGKVQGRVVVEATGAPIPGALVHVLGTTIRNLADDQGYYFLNEVPAGLQTVRAEFIGYRPVEISNERILAGQTTTLDFSLGSSAIELQALVVPGERNPLVPRDQTSTKTIVQGDLVDQLPIDNTASVIVLQPGVVETNQGRTIRGGRPNEEALIVDGVLARAFGTGSATSIELPTNALEQVDVNVGGFSAEFGEAQSGIVNYVTKSGGRALAGSIEYMTDQLSPSDMRTNLNRAELTLGGPVTGPLTFFLAGTATGQDAFTTTDAPHVYVVDGPDICPNAPRYGALCAPGEVATFRLPRASVAPGGTDYVDVTAPNFVEWDNGRTLPYNWSQSDLFHGNLNWQLPRGSRLNFSYNWNRIQDYGPGPASLFDNIYRLDGLDGSLSTRNSWALSWFQTIAQSADQQVALDVLAAYSTDRNTIGMLDQPWYWNHQDPFLGHLWENVAFAFEDVTTLAGIDVLDPSDEDLNAYRSNAVPRDSLLFFPDRPELTGGRQTLPGLADNLRSNPYGMKSGFPTSGTGTFGIHRDREDRLQLRGSVDWQIGRFNRLKAGVEYFDIDLRESTLWMWFLRPLLERAGPTKLGAFVQERLDIGDLVLEAGLRWDRLDPDIEFPRTPGFVYNVPDSLKAGFVELDRETGAYVPLSTPCNGAPVCKSNFVAAATKSEFSPRLGVAFPVTATSTFRLSYGRFVQTPAFFSIGDAFRLSLAQGQVGLLQGLNRDLQDGSAGFDTFARDVDMPSTRTFEFGYRQLIGEDLVVDVSAFNKKQRGALSSRQLPFTNPNDGGTLFLNVITNRDFTESNGFEVKIDKTLGNWVTSNLSYSYLDARGTGSDPFFYEGLIRLTTTNLFALTHEPPSPPSVLLRLEQSRRHNISWTGSIVVPHHFAEGSLGGALLQDLGVFAIMRIRSGLPYTKLRNRGGGQIGPPSQSGSPESAISAAETPWTFGVDLRLTRSFDVGGLGFQAFVDWRNPFDLENTRFVFLETGSAVNELHRRRELGTALQDPSLDGSSDIDDVDIVAETEENAFNTFMLLRAEERWGNGDGIFTVEEQEKAFGQLYENYYGVKSVFETSDQQLRLGLRMSF